MNLAGKKSQSSSNAVTAGRREEASAAPPSGAVKARRVRLTDEIRKCKVKLIVSIVVAFDTTASALNLAPKG
jgi:hypothetical protein